MAGVLAQLLGLRRKREDAAARELGRRRLVLREAEQALSAAGALLTSWRRALPRREQRLFERIAGRRVNRKEVDDMRMRVGELHEREHVLLERRDAARRAYDEAEARVVSARNAYGKAAKNVRKLEEVAGLLAAAARRGEERRQEREFESHAEAGVARARRMS